MLEEIYLERREMIDSIIKQAVKKVENKMNPIEEAELEENRDLFNNLQENYNIKIGSICKDLYLQGLKDGINLIIEAKGK